MVLDSEAKELLNTLKKLLSDSIEEIEKELKVWRNRLKWYREFREKLDAVKSEEDLVKVIEEKLREYEERMEKLGELNELIEQVKQWSKTNSVITYA